MGTEFDLALKFYSLHNFVISNVGVADWASGMNKLAVLAVLPQSWAGRGANFATRKGAANRSRSTLVVPDLSPGLSKFDLSFVGLCCDLQKLGAGERHAAYSLAGGRSHRKSQRLLDS